MSDAFGGSLLAILVCAGLLKMGRAAYRNRGRMSAAQRKTTHVVMGGLVVFALIWFPWEIYTLVATFDPADHITAWHAFLLQDPEFRSGFSLLCAGIIHLMAHLRWRAYPLWPSSEPKSLR